MEKIGIFFYLFIIVWWNTTNAMVTNIYDILFALVLLYNYCSGACGFERSQAAGLGSAHLFGGDFRRLFSTFYKVSI